MSSARTGSPNNDGFSILQWNCQGLRHKKDDILDLVRTHKIDLLALQETKQNNDFYTNLPGYNLEHCDGHFNRVPHGGVGIYIPQDIPYERIQLNTQIQAVAVRAQLFSLITICSIYSSRSHQLNIDTLQNLFAQFPQPVLILGDLNSYNALWGSSTTDSRGLMIENFCNRNNLNILNDGRPTRISYVIQSCIDLSICTPSIESDMQWDVFDSPGPSDHCPILIRIAGVANGEQQVFRSFKRANWDIYCRSPVWQDLPDIETMSNETIKDDLYSRFREASSSSIPQFRPHRFYPKPWWGPELQESRQKRERLYQTYRRHQTPNNAMLWKRARALHKRLVKKSKERCWRNFVETVRKL